MIVHNCGQTKANVSGCYTAVVQMRVHKCSSFKCSKMYATQYTAEPAL